MSTDLEKQRSQELVLLRESYDAVEAFDHGHDSLEIRECAKAVWALVKKAGVQLTPTEFAALTHALADSDYKVPGQGLVLLKPKNGVLPTVTPIELATAINIRTTINEGYRDGDAPDGKGFADYSLPQVIEAARRASVDLDLGTFSDEDLELVHAQLKTFEFRRVITDVDSRGEISHHVAHIEGAFDVAETDGIVTAISSDDDVHRVSHVGVRPTDDTLMALSFDDFDEIWADSAASAGWRRNESTQFLHL